MLSQEGYQARYRTTDEAWHELLQPPTELLVAVGGDGTVGRAARAVVGTGLPFTVLPVGTANNVAKTLGISGDARSVVAGWRSLSARPFDVWSVQGEGGEAMFIESVGGGFVGQPMETADRLHPPTLILGGAIDRALFLMRQAVTDAPELPWEIELDGEDLSGRYIAVEALNIPTVGPNLPLAPDADPGDGAIDLVLISGADRADLRRRFEGVATAQAPGPSRLLVRRGRRLRLVGPAGLSYHVDGEPWSPGADADDGLRHRLEVLLAGQARIVPGAGPREMSTPPG